MVFLNDCREIYFSRLTNLHNRDGENSIRIGSIWTKNGLKEV
jgi:hypothetical protein